jgi:DNA-binding transcriptional regulator of glucitol operon
MQHALTPMFGHFTPAALHAFAALHNLETGSQDFSKGVFDFKKCQSPNGKSYGVSEHEQCKPPAKPVTVAKTEPKAVEPKKKAKEKMCNQYRPWMPVGMQVAIVPCRELGIK